MQNSNGEWVCDHCGKVILPAEPGGPFVPYMILGDATGGERWVACTEACKDELVMKYYRILRGEE
jgi:hypothetical protein